MNQKVRVAYYFALREPGYFSEKRTLRSYVSAAATRSEILPFFFRPIRKASIPSRFAARVLFHPATRLLALSATRFSFSPHLASHTATVATTLLHVRVVFALFARSIVTALLATERD
jgi:hypothetical protein